MKIKSILKMLGIAGRLMVICGLLAACALADDGRPFTCSNATFHGRYGFTANGTINPPGGPTIYISGVQMITADGRGNLVSNEAFIIDGNPLVNNPPSYFSIHVGNYRLNSDCTGLAFLTNDSPLSVPFRDHNFIWLSFVVDKQGKQVRMLGVPPFDSGGVPRTVTSIGERVE